MILANQHVIQRPEQTASVADNEWVHVLVDDAEEATLSLEQLPEQACSVPLAFWLQHRQALTQRDHSVAVQIAADDELEPLADHLADVPMVVLPFDSYVDGRSYSKAYLLRTRHGYGGEIRAVGDVHYDHLNFLARVGVDAFELAPEGDVDAAVAAFQQFSEVYQPSADDGQLIFARRRAMH